MIKETYSIISDEEGHWYVIPDNKRSLALDYFDQVYKYWATFDLREGDEPEEPEWLIPVGGAISLVKFPSYKIGNE
jgi:hypothetical protein